MKVCSFCKQAKSESEYHRFFSTQKNKSYLSARCKECKKSYQRARKRAIKTAVLSQYSPGELPECCCCGETSREFLTLDHVHGGGSLHAKELCGDSRDRWSVYRWIVKSGFPEGFQTLCYNCNCAKHHYGVCPHVRMRELTHN